MTSHDAFPSTHTTWMHGELDAGEERRRALRSIVMARYFEPLRIYVKGSSYRHLGESAELVSAFFVSRFARDDYLDAWRESGMTLRRWLINGLILSMREEVRRRRRAAKRGLIGTGQAGTEPGDDAAEADPFASLESPEPEAVAAFERAWALATLREACEEVETICNADGAASAWLVFRRHFFDGLPYSTLVDESGLEPPAAAAAARMVANRVRAAIRRLIARDGVHPDEVDAEFRRVAAIVERSDHD
jgi:hypothetical protein